MGKRTNHCLIPSFSINDSEHMTILSIARLIPLMYLGPSDDTKETVYFCI